MMQSGEIQTIYDLVQHAKVKYGDKVFLRYEVEGEIEEKCFGEFIEAANCLAAWMKARSIELKHKCHTALLGKCSYEYLVAMIGSLNAGAVTIPLDVQMSEASLIDHLVRSDAEILFYDSKFQGQITKLKTSCPNIKYFVCIQNLEEVYSVAHIINAYEGESFVSDVTPEECALMIFTSGTTGLSKGVMLSHKNMVANLFCIPDEAALFDAVCLNVLPIHHIFSVNTDVLRSFRFGSQLCLCGEVTKLMHAIQTFEPTVIHMVPMMAKMLYNQLVITKKEHPELSMMAVKEKVLGKRLRRLGGGGSYLAESVSINFAEIGIEIAQGYGMSECAPIISTAAYDRLDKLASVGRIVEGCQVRIVEDEIQVKSPSVMMGYYKQPEETAKVMTEDGWLRTGDLGYIDDEGFLYLTGRKKNLIILSNGENVSPEGIENLFDAELLINDILVYGENDSIAAEIYPNYEYAKMNHIDNVERVLDTIVAKHNESLPSYAKITQIKTRQTPFEKTASKKIIRPLYKREEGKKEGAKQIHQPENALQQKLYDIVSGIMGDKSFGIDDHLYYFGLNSLSSMMMIEAFQAQLNQTITLNELIANDTILALEKLFTSGQTVAKIDYTIRESYPLTPIQKYFVYIMKGNTTGNIPSAFKLHESVDLERLKKAIEDTLNAHPSLKGIIRYAKCDILRDDMRQVEIPIIHLTEEAWEKELPTLLMPYKYDGVEALFRIKLYQTEAGKYMYFDMSHAISDGMTYGIILRDMNAAYKGMTLQKESYTFFEYILDHMQYEVCGLRERDIARIAKQMEHAKLSRSILTQKNQVACSEGENGVIRERLWKLSRIKLLEFCEKHSISENTLFIAALNYCASLFSDEEDVFCVSIHSGRTEGKYNNVAGAFFRQYFCRYQKQDNESVLDYLKATSTQIINSMANGVSVVRQGDMFFQFQSDILQVEELGGEKVERIKLQLDSLPFHMQVMVDQEGYYMELRYWANRFDTKLLTLFVDCWQDIVNAMIEEKAVDQLRSCIQNEYYPLGQKIKVGTINEGVGYELVNLDAETELEVYVLETKTHQNQPYGAWGTLCIANYRPENCTHEITNPYGTGTLYHMGQTARILPDGSLDFLQNSGRVVLKDSVRGRQYFDLQKVEQTALSYKGVQSAEAYLSYDEEINEMTLRLDVVLEHDIEVSEIREYIGQRCEEHLVPMHINKVEKYMW